MSAEAELGYCVQQIRARTIGPVVHRQYRQRQRWDPSAEHHIVLVRLANETAVSCGCLRLPGGGHKPIESRVLWDPDVPGGDVRAVWRAHLEEET